MLRWIKKITESTGLPLCWPTVVTEAFLENVSDGVIAIDLKRRITAWNRAAEQLTGFNRAETLGKNFKDYVRLVRERDGSASVAFIDEAIAHGKKTSLANHTLLIRRDKTEIPVSDSASPIIDGKGGVLGVIITLRDVSREVGSRILKTDFQYASHQLRTPLTIVLWSLDVVRTITDKDKRDRILDTAKESARSIGKIADELLAIAEIDQDIILPKREMVNLADVMASVLSETRAAAGRKNIKLSAANGAPISLETDKNLFKSILMELVDNAIKYTKAGGEISVRAEDRSEEVAIEIRDSGIGIIDEQQPLVFTKFFRGTNYDASEIPGAGLGLFIAKSYANVLNGRIWFKSESGRGSSFFVILSKKRLTVGGE